MISPAKVLHPMSLNTCSHPPYPISVAPMVWMMWKMSWKKYRKKKRKNWKLESSRKALYKDRYQIIEAGAKRSHQIMDIQRLPNLLYSAQVSEVVDLRRRELLAPSIVVSVGSGTH